MDHEPPPAPEPAPGQFRCPTCGARQDWSDVCRRCKCDLSLTVAAHRRRSQLRTRCLAHLRADRLDAALSAATELHALTPDDDATRLLAVARLLHGDYAAALQLLAGEKLDLPSVRSGHGT
ncbi:MAG: hypothetical protein GX575_15535 [Candidatus Anammoximicrobium sp.]|nr:hypothetical protein [Candidatus Anammoximicrobium sp.]